MKPKRAYDYHALTMPVKNTIEYYKFKSPHMNEQKKSYYINQSELSLQLKSTQQVMIINSLFWEKWYKIMT